MCAGLSGGRRAHLVLLGIGVKAARGVLRGIDEPLRIDYALWSACVRAHASVWISKQSKMLSSSRYKSIETRAVLYRARENYMLLHSCHARSILAPRGFSVRSLFPFSLVINRPACRRCKCSLCLAPSTPAFTHTTAHNNARAQARAQLALSESRKRALSNGDSLQNAKTLTL